ncbi:MAG: hypothetical protein PWQ22_284 [Archaeoglobaceae archaeon]|nr:hypothetical protein [Archaeoglobaceae archaeon]
MDEIPLELVIGLIFVAVVLLVPYMPKKKIALSFKTPNLRFSRKKKEDKLKEIDKKLEEVLSADLKNEKIVKLDEATEEAAKKFEIKGDLLSEMQTSNNLAEPLPEPKNEISEQKVDLALPNLENLEEIPKVEEIILEPEEQKEEETKLEFEDSDKLIEDIAKEVERKEEEEIDLLKDLKGQKFLVEELERELKEALEKTKRLRG